MWRVILLSLCFAVPAAAAPYLSGEATLVSDYRFRGISRSDAGPAVQGRLVLEAGDFYAEGFASSLGGWGRFGGADAELDVTIGVQKPFGLGTIGAGVTVYNFVGADRPATVVEAQGRLSGGLGPLRLVAGAAWAPPQRGLAALGEQRGDNLHLWGSARAAVIGTPFSVHGRIGHSRGAPGLGGAGALAQGARAWDWRLGVDYALGPLTLGADVVGTDLGDRADALLATPRGGRIAGTGVFVRVGAGF
jgi:uncharacterized protein (TIGR02001 family)